MLKTVYSVLAHYQEEKTVFTMLQTLFKTEQEMLLAQAVNIEAWQVLFEE